MLNLFQLVGPWLMIGVAALLLLIFVAVFAWNSPRRATIRPAKRPPPDVQAVESSSLARIIKP